jgi:zinc/manganese transport system substrate-binding protein/manganese/iron transport system substrate-binding protein
MRRGLILAAVLVVALAGCATWTPQPSDGRLRVVATTTQVGEAARVVGGDEITLTVLLRPGAEAHEFELTPPAAAAIEKSDVILESGAGLEAWLEAALRAIGGADRLHDMSSGVDLRLSENSGLSGAGARPMPTDPHYWLTAPNAIRMVENVRDALSAARPDLASGFAERGAAYITRLRAADVEIRRLMDEIPPARRGIVTNHDALGYFVAEYGLQLVGSVFPSLDVSSEPDPAQLAALADTIRAQGVTAIFSESAVNPRLARAIAQESGARVVDTPLYTDSLGPPGSGFETLDGMLLHDAQVIHDALTGG